MANKKLSDGVGKKIVEALKKQSEVEITPIKEAENDAVVENPMSEDFSELDEVFGKDEEETSDDAVFDEVTEETEPVEAMEMTPEIAEEPVAETIKPFNSNMNTMNSTVFETQKPQETKGFYQQKQDSLMNDLDGFEIPNNIAVLKRLITQLPSGVSRHTGAQIIKQTMEALGISMKSVLQEAQQVQESLNDSANECSNNIQEYKKQILLLEKQSQNYHKQYNALNELISLFVQTGI